MRAVGLGVRAGAVAAVLALTGLACSGDGDALTDAAHQSEDPGDCLLNWIPFATVAFELDVGRARVVEADSVESGFVLETAIDTSTWTVMHDSLVDADLAVIELLDAGLAEGVTEALSDPDRQRLVVVGRTNPVRRFATTLIDDRGDDGFRAFDPCTRQWRDITAELTAAIASMEADDLDDALAQIAARQDGPIHRFLDGWESVSDAAPPWEDRAPDLGTFADADIPADVAATPRMWLIHLVATGEIDGTPYALCSRQTEALGGHCVSLSALATEPLGLILEVGVDRREPIEFWIHDERLEPGGGVALVATVQDPEVDTRLDVGGRLDANAEPAEVASQLTFTLEPAEVGILELADGPALPLVGGFDVTAALADAEPTSSLPTRPIGLDVFRVLRGSTLEVFLVACHPTLTREVVEQTPTEIVVTLEEAYLPPTTNAAGEAHGSPDCQSVYLIELDAPLGDRPVIDGSTGEPVPQLDN